MIRSSRRPSSCEATRVDRLTDIPDACEAIRAHLDRGGLDDGLVYDAVRVRLIELGEAVKGVSTEILAREPRIEWRAIARLRDQLAHRYFDTDHANLTDIVDNELGPLIVAVRALLSRVDERATAIPTGRAHLGSTEAAPADDPSTVGTGHGSSRINWPPGVQRLLDEIRFDVDDLIANGRMSRAAALIERTGVDFDPTCFPMYFTGDFAARLVLVHLNPKLADLSRPRFADVDSCLERHRRFGYYHWGQDPTYKSRFDHKQVRFLRPFGAIDFLLGTDAASMRRNAELAIDAKLQLELVPYASRTFPTHRLSATTLRAHFDRVLGAIAAYPRDYVLFCGAVFDELLETAGIVQARTDHRFRLPTSNGLSVDEYRFSNVTLRLGDAEVRAGVARSLAIQGIPMAAYGERCHELYDAEG